MIDTYYSTASDKRGISDFAVIFNFRRADELRVLKLKVHRPVFCDRGNYQLKTKDYARITTEGNCLLIADISPTNPLDYFYGSHFERVNVTRETLNIVRYSVHSVESVSRITFQIEPNEF